MEPDHPVSMSQTLQLVIALVERQDVLISEHGYDALVADGLLVREIIAGIRDAVVVEAYPEYHKRPCVLVLQRDQQGKLIHVVWGIPQHATAPAVIVTAYRPDAARWTDDYLRRKT